jgi:phosphocarrier protein
VDAVLTDGEGDVVQTEMVIRNQLGLHARACALFVKTAARFQAEVYVARDDLEVNGKSIMGVMMLAAEYGSELLLRADGSDEQDAVSAIAKLIESKFGES